MSDMLARLGNVLYWAANIAAVLFVLFSVAALGVGYYNGRVLNSDALFIAGGPILLALFCYLFGRACRYVLAGK